MSRFGRSSADEIAISSEVDQVYAGVSGDVQLVDSARKAPLTISNKLGWSDTVLWNPYGNEDMGYDGFVCVESAQARGASPAFRPGSPIVIVARAAQQRATRHLRQRRKSLLASSLPLHYKPPTAPTSPRKAGRPPLIADAHHSLPAATACRTLLIQRYELRNLAGVRAVRELLHNRCATVVGRLPRRSCWARTSTGPVPWTSCPNHVLLSVRCSGHATWHLRPREACCAVREPSRDSARTLRTQGLVCELRVRLVCCGGRD